MVMKILSIENLEKVLIILEQNVHGITQKSYEQSESFHLLDKQIQNFRKNVEFI